MIAAITGYTSNHTNRDGRVHAQSYVPPPHPLTLPPSIPTTQVGPPILRPHGVPVARSAHALYQPVSGFTLYLTISTNE